MLCSSLRTVPFPLKTIRRIKLRKNWESRLKSNAPYCNVHPQGAPSLVQRRVGAMAPHAIALNGSFGEASLLIDSHARLDGPSYTDDRADMLRRAHDAGVGTVLSIGIGEGPAEMCQAHDLCGGRALRRRIWKASPTILVSRIPLLPLPRGDPARSSHRARPEVEPLPRYCPRMARCAAKISFIPASARSSISLSRARE